MRILHISDLHIDGGLGFPTPRLFLNKRLVGWLNLQLRRAKYYKNADQKVAKLAELIERERIDLVLCSGDYTALGTDSELKYARRTIAPLTKAPLGFVTVPGNHDVYLADAEGAWLREFDAFLTSDLPAFQVDGPWPLVRLFEGVAVVCVDSARPNPSVLRSSGRIPASQLAALREVLQSPEVRSRFVFVMTHYAPRLKSGKPDTPHHGLENADALLDVCDAIERGALLHGHVHRRFTVQPAECAIRMYGAGSTTQEGHEGLWLFDVDGGEMTAHPGSFAGGRYTVED